MCGRLSSDMGLRLSGIDLLVEGDIGDPRSKYQILEINGNPGLTSYPATAEEYWRELEEMSIKVLKALEAGPR
jgi:D-alanine-D-alanine ligase-like ATP-grasp enzyme